MPRLGRGVRIDSEMRATRQPLVGADVAEAVAAGEGDTFRDPQLDPIGHVPPLLPPGLCGWAARATSRSSTVASRMAGWRGAGSTAGARCRRS